MTYIITEPCVGVKDASCVAVCPVDCIISTDADDMYFINPDECIDCGACVPECPVNAIFAEEEVPDELKAWIPVNHQYPESSTPHARTFLPNLAIFWLLPKRRIVAVNMPTPRFTNGKVMPGTVRKVQP